MKINKTLEEKMDSYSKSLSELNKKEDEIKYSLSTREKEVLEQICNGLSNQEIADTLFISRRTVEKHRSNLLEKTNCKNTANLVMFTINNNLLDNN